jgi:hypothetical protein
MLMVLVTACKVKKELPAMNPEVMATQELWKAIEAQNIEYEWFYAKADVQVKTEDFNMGGNADIRIRKDSIIFMSIRKFGLELARVKVTPDSIFALNRLQAQYVALPIDSLQAFYDVPFDFSELQEVVVGNHFTRGLHPIRSTASPQGYWLKSAGEQLEVAYLLNENKKVEEAVYTDKEGHSVEVQYGNEKTFDSLLIPSERSYFYPSIENAEYTLKMIVNKVEIDKAKKIKFEIPSAYTRI